METVRRDFRVIVDLRHGTIVPRQVEIVQLVPQGELYYRIVGGGMQPVASEALYSGESYVTSTVHPHLADAAQEAAAELRRRGEHLLALALRCEQIEEIPHA